MIRICLISIFTLVAIGCSEAPQTRITKPSVETKPSAGTPEKPESLTEEKPKTVRPAVTTNSPVIKRSEILEKRGAVVGKTFTTLTVGGRQYSSVTVKEINDAGMKIQHESGIATIDWKITSNTVRDAWGYDESAYVEAQKVVNAKIKAVPQEKSPIIEAKRIEAKRTKDIERRKSKLQLEIDKIEAEISRGTVMLESFNKALKVAKEKFAEEDSAAAARKRARSNTGEDGGEVSRSIGGISTSKADRKKNTEVEEARVKNAKTALSKLKTKLKTLERELKNL